MNSSRFQLSASVLAFACGLALAAGAMAQGDQSPKSGSEVLGGPKIQDRNVPGQVGAFGEKGELQKRASDRLPPGAMRRALESAIGPDAPESVRATAEQREKIEKIVRDHEAQVRAYMDQHREEIEQIRKDAGLGQGERRGERRGPGGLEGRAPRGAGRPDGAPPEMNKDDQAKADAARQKIRDLMEAGPKQSDLMTKVWAELTPAQQDATNKALDEVRERMKKEREDRYVRQRVGRGEARPGPGGAEGRRPGPDGAAPGRPPAGPGERGMHERRERLLRLFDSLPPEAQDQLLRRLEERLGEMRDGRGPDGPGRPGGPDGPRGRRLERRPPPDMDDIRMPPPPPPPPPAPEAPDRGE